MSNAKASSKKRYQYYFSPIGKAVYPKLITPDTKFKAEGEYSTKLEYSLTDPKVAKGTQDLIEMIDREMEKSLEIMAQDLKDNPRKDKKGKFIEAFLCEDAPYIVNEDEGKSTFSFKMKASYKDKKTGAVVNKRPNLYDANGSPITNFQKLNIGGGSLLVVNFYIQHWFTDKLGAGVKLAMQDVQIVKLVEFSRDPGFQKNEGGFTNAPDTSGNDDSETADAQTAEYETQDAGKSDPENF